METLWESLEELLDAEGNPGYEVEYSVRFYSCPYERPYRPAVLPSRVGCLHSSWVIMGRMLLTSSPRTNKSGSRRRSRK